MSTEAPRMPEHGTRARYQRGCRCRACTLDNTLYQRGYRFGQKVRAYHDDKPITVRGVTWVPMRLPFDASRVP